MYHYFNFSNVLYIKLTWKPEDQPDHLNVFHTERKQSLNPFASNYVPDDDSIKIETISNEQQNEDEQPAPHLTLTKAEFEALREVPKSTTNALKAVMGYVPQDDKRVCQFYDPKTGRCFKGNHCTLEHIPILKGSSR